MSRKSYKTYENTVKSPKSMLALTFSKAIQLARLESLLS